MAPNSSFPTTLARRSVIAAAAALAFGAGPRNSARAQDAADGLPDAASVIDQSMPSPAPDLKFTDASGKPLSLATYKGSGLLVNLWATWCGPCVAELPTFAAIGPALKKSRILILPISVDMDGAKAVKPFYAGHGISDLPMLLDPDGANLNVLNAPGIPVTIIVNPQGQLVGRLDGSADWNTAATLALVRQLAGPRMDSSDVQPA